MYCYKYYSCSWHCKSFHKPEEKRRGICYQRELQKMKSVYLNESAIYTIFSRFNFLNDDNFQIQVNIHLYLYKDNFLNKRENLFERVK